MTLPAFRRGFLNGAAALGILTLVACGGSEEPSPVVPLGIERAAKVAACSPGDRPETGLQGQVSAAARQAGFNGANCNLRLVGQVAGEGGNWSTAMFRDSRGNTCAYHGTGASVSFATREPVTRIHPGVAVIDITQPEQPVRTTSLTSKGMLDPWESLKVSASRKLLIGVNGTNSTGGPDFDIYDLSADCRQPQLVSSLALTYDTGVDATPTRNINGHEGAVSPDGLTYYVGDLANGVYHAVDITVPTRPRVIAKFDMRANSPIAKTPHGLSVSGDGNRVYAVAMGVPSAAQVADAGAAPQNGFLVLDTSEVQARRAGAQMRLLGTTAFRDGSVAQHTIEMKIRGRPYLAMVDEGGGGGPTSPTAVRNACNAGLSPFPMARVYDMSDETRPLLLSKLGLETHDIKNCETVLPDITGLNFFTYGSHYCSVDNRENATAMACSYFNSGIRVFDIRDPSQPREIAYFNPPGLRTAQQGSAHVSFGQWRAGGPDWCASRLDFDFERRLLTTMCQDNGLLVMRFADGVWPMPESTPSTLQN